MPIELDSNSLETIFSFGSTLAIFGWLILWFAPRQISFLRPLWSALNTLPTLIIPSLLAIAYSALVFTSFSSTGGDFSSLAGVRQLFTSDVTLLAGWIHYLAFDLFVGTVIARQADEIGLHRIIQFPILVMTLMFGPAGFLLFQLTRGGLALFSNNKG